MSAERIEAQIQELRLVLGLVSDELLPVGKMVAGLSKESFQSDDFRKAGLYLDSGRENEIDRVLYFIEFDDGTKLFIATGKQRTDNPYELMWGGPDLRKTNAIAYLYNGTDTIIEIPLAPSFGDERVEHRGEAGKPETLLFWLRKWAGKQIKVEDLLT